MSTWLFVGPTLAGVPEAAFAGVRRRPPIAAGDVCRAVLAGASRIAIVDGFWGDRPSVRHKEILWALARGVPVLGAASMGALRAAELAPFGMIGIGEIFARYASGELTRDGDVAVAHAPADLGWSPLTLPIVDLEARLRRGLAAQTNHVDEAALQRWLTCLRELHVVERTLEAALARLRAMPRALRPPATVLAWLAASSHSQKRVDAELLLEVLAQPTPRPAPVVFHGGIFHERLLAEATRRPGGFSP